MEGIVALCICNGSAEDRQDADMMTKEKKIGNLVCKRLKEWSLVLTA